MRRIHGMLSDRTAARELPEPGFVGETTGKNLPLGCRAARGSSPSLAPCRTSCLLRPATLPSVTPRRGSPVPIAGEKPASGLGRILGTQRWCEASSQRSQLCFLGIASHPLAKGSGSSWGCRTRHPINSPPVVPIKVKHD